MCYNCGLERHVRVWLSNYNTVNPRDVKVPYVDPKSRTTYRLKEHK